MINLYSQELVQIYKDPDNFDDLGTMEILPDERAHLNSLIEDFKRGIDTHMTAPD